MTTRPRMSLVAPSLTTRMVAAAILLIVGVSGALLIWQYPRLPELLPVHFKINGRPNGWQYKTWARVMMPVLVQLALALTMGAVATLLLSRAHGTHDDDAPDVKAARTSAEAVALFALIWVDVPGVRGVCPSRHVVPRTGRPRRLVHLLRAVRALS